MLILTDQSRMPFGKHQWVPLEKLDADYLLYIWEDGLWNGELLKLKYEEEVNNSWDINGIAEQRYAVHKYIKSNFDALEMDAKDIIVTPRPN